MAMIRPSRNWISRSLRPWSRDVVGRVHQLDAEVEGEMRRHQPLEAVRGLGAGLQARLHAPSARSSRGAGDEAGAVVEVRHHGRDRGGRQ